MKRYTQAAVAVLLLLVPVFFLRLGSADPFSFPPERTILDGGTLGDLTAFIDDNFPHKAEFESLSLSVRFFGGQREYKGQREYDRIFISGDELIPDLDPPTTDHYTRENTEAILEFADRAGVSTYCMILPTVSAIRQESLPPFSQAQVFNQKQYIEEVYSQMSGRVTVANVYQTLFDARDQYLFYRTEDSLTALGGYYVYSVLSKRLREGTPPPSLSDYDIEYVSTPFYGGLYADSPFKNARADVLALYHYTGGPREYLVEKRGETSRTYHTLYPRHMPELGNPLSIYLGGTEGYGSTTVTSNARSSYVTSNAPSSYNLLVFGDKKALPFLPFLCNHYQTVTLVDLFQLDSEGYAEIRVEDYDQVLFSYGIDDFMHNSHPARALRFLEKDEN